MRVASCTALDLGGAAQTVASVSGDGAVSNGTLTVTDTLAPGGTNRVGVLTLSGSPVLRGATLLADVATDGTGDRLVCTGDLSLEGVLLQVANPGVEEDFFDLGGHSLLAVQLFSAVRQELGVEMQLSAVLQEDSHQTGTCGRAGRHCDQVFQVVLAVGDEVKGHGQAVDPDRFDENINIKIYCSRHRSRYHKTEYD